MSIFAHAPQASPDLLADAIEALSEGLAIYDAENRLVTCNRRYIEMLHQISDLIKPGADFEKLLKACAERNVYAMEIDDVDAWAARIARDPASGAAKPLIEHSDGRAYRVSYNPISSGGFVVTRAEVTERLRAEQQVREHEELLRTIIETNPTPVFMARLSDSRIIYRSPAAYRIYGDATHTVSTYMSPADRDAFVARLKAEGQVRDYHLALRGAEGSVHTVSINGALTEYEGETCVVSSLTDLTEQLEREALIRMVVEACPAPILMNRAATGEILFKSPKIIELYGAGDDASEFYIDPEDRAGFVQALRDHGQVFEHRSRFRNAKGEPFWGAVSARLIKWEGEEVIVSHARDLTGQLAIEAELSRQREQLFQNEKMTALGGLLAGVAHELNNPLSVVVGHAMMLQDEARDPDVLRQIGKISEAADRCARIVKTFLAMARQEPSQTGEARLDQIVETAVEVARYGDSAHAARIETDCAPDLPAICADADQITQVVINMIVNAEQAIQGLGSSNVAGGVIRVRTRPGETADEVRIIVEDDGPGVSPELRARVFEPFFTTKGVGMGTGIGLAMCHRIVTAHDGRIELDPVAPHGARFTVTLPVDAAQKTPRAALEDARTEPAATRVLVVDDEKEVADLNAEVLERGGYRTRTAYRAEDALGMLREDHFDVVVSDLNMPGLDGRGLYEVIVAEFPDLAPRTGFITGDTMGRASQGFLQESGRPYLEKPLSPAELRSFVSRLALEGTPG
ncbi:PAS-domain containing protein [Halovulum sp. GXIMD14794]